MATETFDLEAEVERLSSGEFDPDTNTWAVRALLFLGALAYGPEATVDEIREAAKQITAKAPTEVLASGAEAVENLHRLGLL